MVKNQIDITHKVRNLFFDDAETKVNDHVYVIKIKIHDEKTGKKEDAARWMQWFEIKNMF